MNIIGNKFIIKNLNDFKLFNSFHSNIIITDKSNITGYIQRDCDLWYLFSNSKKISHESLIQWLRHNSKKHTSYNKYLYLIYKYTDILNDILLNCFNPNPVFHQIQYQEFVLRINSNTYVFDAVKNNFSLVNNYLPILTPFIYSNSNFDSIPIDNIDTSIVDLILHHYYPNNTLLDFKNFCSNIFLKQSNSTNIFYDNLSFLSTWLFEIFEKITEFCNPNKHIWYLSSVNYYDHIQKFKKLIKTSKPRFAYIKKHKYLSIDTIIHDFSKLGISNIIVNTSPGYLSPSFQHFNDFINNHHDLLRSHLPLNLHEKLKFNQDQIDYYIFSPYGGLLPLHFLKWLSS